MSYRRYDSRDGSNSQVVGFLSGCVAGLVIGGAIGLLMAPHRGDITRRKIARRAEETKDQVVEKVEPTNAARCWEACSENRTLGRYRTVEPV